MINPDAPAFPGFSCTDGHGNMRRNEHSGEWELYEAGMSLRAWFAGQAMAGLLADHKDHEDERRFHYESPAGDRVADGPDKRHVMTVYDETCPEAVARLAVEHADCLIAALNKPISSKPQLNPSSHA